MGQVTITLRRAIAVSATRGDPEHLGKTDDRYKVQARALVCEITREHDKGTEFQTLTLMVTQALVFETDKTVSTHEVGSSGGAFKKTLAACVDQAAIDEYAHPYEEGREAFWSLDNRIPQNMGISGKDVDAIAEA